MTEGLRLDFRIHPPPLTLSPPPWILPSEVDLPIIRSFLPSLLERRIIRELFVDQPLFFSRVFVVTKKDGPYRMIIDLSKLNDLLVIPTFQMESVLKIAQGIVEALWGCTIDLKDAYFHVPMGWAFHHYLAFSVDGRVFLFQYLPFGLSVAPWAFHRIIKPVMAYLHRRYVQIHSYLDDFLNLHPTQEGLKSNTALVLSLFQRLGIMVNYKKSSLTPSRNVVFLGVLLRLDRLTMELPPSTALKIISLCGRTLSRSRQSRRCLESLMGLLNFAAPLVPLGRLRLRPLIMWMNSHSSASNRDVPILLDSPFKDLLRIWQSTAFLSLSVPMSIPVPQLQLMTDASLSGWSGVLLPYRVSGHWPGEYRDRSINWLELQAVFRALQHFLWCLKGRSVLILCDNTTVVSCLLHQGTLRSGSLMALSQQVLEFCYSHSILPVPKYLQGSLNVLADSGSRQLPVQTEWELDGETFQWLSSLAGPFQVDLFATRDNAKLQSFVSPFPDPLAVGVNALSLQWDEWERIYLFPPVPVLRAVVPRLRRFSGRGLLVAPFYAASDWCPSLLIRSPLPLPLPVSHSLSQVTSKGRVFHPNPSVFCLHAWRL